MKNLLTGLIVLITLFLSGCGSSGGSSDDTTPKNENVNLLGDWNVAIFDGSSSVNGISSFTKEIKDGICRAYHKPYTIDGKSMYFEHYTWHVTDSDLDIFTDEFKKSWCEDDGYKSVSKATMDDIISKLDVSSKTLTNTPCSLSEFTSNKIVLECSNGWKETYERTTTPTNKLIVKSVELK